MNTKLIEMEKQFEKFKICLKSEKYDYAQRFKDVLKPDSIEKYKLEILLHVYSMESIEIEDFCISNLEELIDLIRHRLKNLY